MGTKICSLCMVRLKPDGFSKHLVRLADLEGNIFVPIRMDEEGINRHIIHYGPEFDLPEKYIGLFIWEPFYDDKWKQDVKLLGKPWMEVIDKTAIPPQQLMEELERGIEWCDDSHDLFLLFEKDLAIHWPQKQMRLIDGKYTYSTDTKALYVYKLNESYIQSCSNNIQSDDRKYYATFELGDIYKKLWIFSSEKLISTIISNHIKTFIGLTKRDRQNIRKFLDNIDDPTIVDEISKELDCEIHIAEQYYNKYLSRINTMLSVEDGDGALFQNLIDNDSELSKKMLQAVEINWKLTNQDFILEFEKLKREIQSKKNELFILEEKISQGHQTINGLKTLDLSIKEKINERIISARADMGTLLSDYSWLIPANMPTTAGKTDFFISSKSKYNDHVEETESLELAQYNLKNNLAEAGVLEEKLITELAQFLIAAYCNKINLLIAGVGGIDIAFSLSAAICCSEPAILNLHKDISQKDILNVICTCQSDIIVIPNALSAELFDQTITSIDFFPQKMFIFLTPFTDYLMVEPRGLYQYMIPFFTDYYVSVPATRDYTYESSRQIVTDFSLPKKEVIKAKAEILSISSTLALSPRQETAIASIRAALGYIFRDANLDQICFRTMYMPLAISMGKADALSEVKNSLSLDSDTVEKLTAYLERRV
jgi:hypothetical protein